MNERHTLVILKVSDVPAEYRASITFAGVDVRIVTQRTGFGYRRYFLCPSCGRKCGKLHREKDRLYCQRCTPLDLYGYRRDLYDEGGTALIVWHMERLAKTIGIQHIQYPFWWMDYPDDPPPGMSRMKYTKTLLKIQRMEQLRIAAIFLGFRFSAHEIKEYTREL